MILGIAFKFPDMIFERFLKTAREFLSNEEIVIFVSNPTGEARDIFKQYNASLVEVDSANYHLQTWRYVLYERYLSEVNPEFVFLTDVRDVVFQGDIFSKLKKLTFDQCFFQEGKLIRDCETNSLWIKEGFGDDLYGKVQDEPIICSGTTFGTLNGIMEYLKIINQVAPKIMSKNLSRPDGIDQGIHNALIRSGAFKNYKIFSNDNGPIITLQYAEHKINNRGFVTNLSGSVPEVAHQIDRMPREMINQIGKLRSFPVIDLIATRNIIEGREALDFSGLDI